MRHLPALLLAAALFAAGPASAFTIDFTDSAWTPANPVIGLPPTPVVTFTVNDIDGSGVDVTATVTMGTGVLGSGPSLITDTVDISPPAPPDLPNGLGATLGFDSSEIDRAEIVRISFSQPVMINSFLVSRFFQLGVSGDAANELGSYTVEGGSAVQFEASASDPDEGRQGFLLGSGPINFIDFSAPGPADNDYSIVSIDFSVPEPGTLALLGCAGLFAAGRRRRLA